MLERRMAGSTFEGVPPPFTRRPLKLRRAGAVALVLFVGAGLFGLLGDRTVTTTATENGYTLTLTHSALSRSGLSARWELTVERDQDFTEPIDVVVGGEYFDAFDHQALDPEAVGQTSDDTVEYWTFAPPPGDTLRISVDHYVQPGRRFSASGSVAVLVDGERVAPIEFTTRLLP